MLYGVGYDTVNTDDPYRFFSIDNSDPGETNAIKFYNIVIDDTTITALLSSNSQANDFFFVTEANINYLQEPGKNFRWSYQLEDYYHNTVENLAATRTSSGLFVAQLIDQESFKIAKYEVAPNKISSGLAFVMDVTASLDVQQVRTDFLISAWLEDDTDFVTACFTYTDYDDEEVMDVHWVSIDGNLNPTSSLATYMLGYSQNLLSARMSDSTTALVLLNDDSDFEVFVYSLCTFEFLGNTYSCFQSPDTFEIY